MSITLVAASSIKIPETEQALLLSWLTHDFDDCKFFSHKQTSQPTVIIPEIKSSNEYSHWIIHELHKHIETTHVLIVQWDGWVIEESCFDRDFLKYDYIGSPWRFAHTSKFKRYFKVAGQGGFSLRSKKMCEATAEVFAGQKIEFAEDRLISIEHRDTFEAMGLKFAPWELAKKFSAIPEEIGQVPSWGFHSKPHAARLTLTNNGLARHLAFLSASTLSESNAMQPPRTPARCPYRALYGLERASWQGEGKEGD